MPSEPVQQIGRLALREEGTLWVAYYAMPATMDGALFLGSIRLVAVKESPDRRKIFMDLMREIVADLIEEKIGVRPTWGDPKPGLESERGGRG